MILHIVYILDGNADKKKVYAGRRAYSRDKGNSSIGVFINLFDRIKRRK